jgi:hypothetical protein
MIETFFNLNNQQKILFYGAMSAISVQVIVVNCMNTNKKFQPFHIILYLIFNSLAYIVYYKMVISD